MRTRNLTITLNQGCDFNLIIRISNESGPVDITGYSFLGQLSKNTYPMGVSVASFTFTILNQVTNKGQVKCGLDAFDIDEIVSSISTPLDRSRLITPFLYDVKMKDTSNIISRILQGNAEVSPQVTQVDFS